MAGAFGIPIQSTGEDHTILARTLFGEARGEEPLGQIAVAWVIVNRALRAQKFAATYHARHPLFGDGTITSACQCEHNGIHQFSCWNTFDAGYRTMMAANAQALASMAAVAEKVLAGYVQNPIGNCTHYFNPHAVAKTPPWAVGKTPFAAIGHHLFFDNVE
jgi:spore germination cell wall hydrolase CwlJ-like protein